MAINFPFPTYKRAFVAAILMLSLSGCLISVPVTVAKLAIDSVSYVATGKSTTDHAISGLSGQDCALHRVIAGNDVCKERVITDGEETNSLLAYMPDAPAGEVDLAYAPSLDSRTQTAQDVMSQMLNEFDNGNGAN